MTQHDPTSHTGAMHRRGPAAPRRPHGEPAAWPAEIPDPNSLPTDWSPSGTAHAGSTYGDYGTPPHTSFSAYTPEAPTGFSSVESTGYNAVVTPRAGRSSDGYPGEPGGAHVAWLPAPTEPGGAPASRSRSDAPTFHHRSDAPASHQRADSPDSYPRADSRDRAGEGLADAPGRSGRSPEFDPASSWNGNTAMGAARTTTDRDRNPWVVTPVPDRIPHEWDDTTVPDSIPQSWSDETRYRAEPPIATWNAPSEQGRTSRAMDPEAAPEPWQPARPGPAAEPPARSWYAAPAEPGPTAGNPEPPTAAWNAAPPEPASTGWPADRAEPAGSWNVPPTTRQQSAEPVAGNWNEPVEPATGSWHMPGRATTAREIEVVDGSWRAPGGPGQAGNGEPPASGSATGALVPRTEAGSSVLEKPEPATSPKRRNPKPALVAALIAAALAGGGVGAGIMAVVGGGAASSAPAAPAGGAPGGPVPGTQPSQAAG